MGGEAGFGIGVFMWLSMEVGLEKGLESRNGASHDANIDFYQSPDVNGDQLICTDN